MNAKHTLIIRRDANETSIRYAKGAETSAKQHSDTNVEYVKAIEHMTLDQASAELGLPLPDEKEAFNLSNTIFHHKECLEMGNICCTASHVKAWRRVIELNEPCAIFEHDALALEKYDGFIVPKDAILHLGPRMSVLGRYQPTSPPVGMINIPVAIGTHAYMITPEVADKLLGNYEKYGLMWGVDWYLFMGNACQVPIIAPDPYPVICYSRESTMGDHSEEYKLAEKRGVWADLNDKNLLSQTTPGLLKGLGYSVYG